MNSGLPEMLHCLNSSSTSESTEMCVLERQRFRFKLQQEHLIQPQVTYFNENQAFLGLNSDQGLCELLVTGAMKPDPGFQTGWSDRYLNYGNGSEFEMGGALPRTVSSPPNVAASQTGKESSKKRKADKTQNLKVIGEERSEEKKMKGCGEEDSKSTTTITTASTATNNKNSTSNRKENLKVSEDPKTDYIHVRARRGQATDSHSLAERVRREKISERMKYLQDLVPGCNKITGKAGMLDEIINYVQSLQRQVEFLSMKLAAINPRQDFDIDEYLVKEMFPASSPDMVNHSQLQFNTLGQGVSGSSLEMVVNPMDVALRRTISAPVSIPQTFLDSSSSSLNQIQQMTWGDDLQNPYGVEYQQGPFTGYLDGSHVKLEM